MNKFTPLLICYFLVALIGFNSTNIYAQSGDASTDIARIKTITPNAPTTASLGRFGEYPVNNVYGLPGISVPLLDFSSGGIMQKLNLQYHADGLKVRERASWVGLGWSLFAGGVITANINGTPDLQGYFGNVSIIPTLQERITRLLRTSSNVDSITMGMSMANTIIYGERIGYATLESDAAPDIYNISADALSGSFVFNSDWKPVLTDATLPIKVDDISNDYTTTYSSGIVQTARLGIYGFSVTDKDGYNYVFGLTKNNASSDVFVESTSTKTDAIGSPTNGYISAWYLNKIYSPDRRDSVEFFYEKDVDIVDIIPSFYISRSYCENNDYKTFMNIETHTIKLSKIKFKNGQINFYRSSWHVGVDEENEDSKLDSIREFSSDNLINPIKTIILNYERFTNKDNSENLKLANVKFNGSDKKMVQQYTFYYNPLQLPGRNSCDLDHWGYYNGANNPGTSAQDYSGPYGLIPQSTSSIGNPAGGFWSITEGEGNRNPNENFSQACILNKVQYPTGGNSQFIYENHKTNDGITRGGLRIKQILNFENNSAIDPLTKKEYDYSGGYLVGFEPTEFTYVRRYYRNCASCLPNLNTCVRCTYTDRDKILADEVLFSSNGKGIYQNQSTTAYTQVIEKLTDKSGNHLGKTVYKYVEQKDICKVYGSTGSINSFFTPYQSFATIRENPSFIGLYDFNDTPVKETENRYYNSGINTVLAMGLMVERNNFYAETHYQPPICNLCCQLPQDFNSNYFIATYQIMQLKNQLTKTIEKNYSSSGIIIDTTSYFYSTALHPFPVRIEKRNSNGNTITLINKYPLDYLTSQALTYGQVHELQDKHVLSATINNSKLVNNLLTDCDITEYEGLYPKTIYSVEVNAPIAVPSYSSTSPQVYIFPSELTQYLKPKLHLTYLNGKIISQQKELDVQNSYLWGYNNTFPIAETKNAAFAECSFTSFENNEMQGWLKGSWNYVVDPSNAKTGRSYLTGSNGGPYNIFSVGLLANNHNGYKACAWAKGSTDAYIKIGVIGQSSLNKIFYNPSDNSNGDWNLLTVELPYTVYKDYITSGLQLRVTCGSTSNAKFDDLRFYPMDAQMTTYTYDPLIGVTSVSDVNNKPSIYKYDPFNRLWYIKDFQGNILKKYNYNYKP